MKLLVIGSAPQSNICINSQFVSGYHAELILLDNGDMFIVDKHSKNGTTLNGMKLSPDIEALVKRGDSVVFADSPLDWSRIPELKIDASAKKIIGIGSHVRNKIHVSGDKVSRFHATIKETRDGKWLICDHSTNGTTLNGQRIPKDIYVKLKKKDQIKCAGIPVENPIASESDGGLALKVVAACLAALIVGAGIFFVIQKTKTMTPDEIYAKYSPSTVFLYFGYHYIVSAGSLDVKEAFGSADLVVRNGLLVEYDGDNSMEGTATGFYISKDGLIATNLHVARPWIFDDNVQPVEDLVRARLNRLARTLDSDYLNYISLVKVTGKLDFCYAVPNGNYFDEHNAIRCSEEYASDNTETDVAVMRARLAGGKLPEGASYVNVYGHPKYSYYKPGIETYAIGFPLGGTLQNLKDSPLQAIGSSGQINNVKDKEKMFGLDALAEHGSSGSPVFDNKGHLLGVVNGKVKNYNYAVLASELQKLLPENVK